MTKEYLEMLMTSEAHFLYFDRERAEKKADNIRKEGKRAEIIRIRGAWEVFQFNKLNK
jgi:hypothetical protein